MVVPVVLPHFLLISTNGKSQLMILKSLSLSQPWKFLFVAEFQCRAAFHSHSTLQKHAYKRPRHSHKLLWLLWDAKKETVYVVKNNGSLKGNINIPTCFLSERTITRTRNCAFSLVSTVSLLTPMWISNICAAYVLLAAGTRVSSSVFFFHHGDSQLYIRRET